MDEQQQLIRSRYEPGFVDADTLIFDPEDVDLDVTSEMEGNTIQVIDVGISQLVGIPIENEVELYMEPEVGLDPGIPIENHVELDMELENDLDLGMIENGDEIIEMEAEVGLDQLGILIENDVDMAPEADLNLGMIENGEELVMTGEVGLDVGIGVIENGEVGIPVPKRVRKRKSDPKSWLCNLRKTKHQAGEAYTSVRGKQVMAKTVVNKKDCENKCVYNCSQHISMEERSNQLKAYLSLTQNEKHHYLLNTTNRLQTSRQRKQPRGHISRRAFTFQYHFNVKNERIQVCKVFFLGTLGISAKPVYNVHNNKDNDTSTPKPDARGKNIASKRAVSDDNKDLIREHIKSFPAVASHYCRSSTTKMYLEAGLNVAKMYDLFIEKCRKDSVPLPYQKKSMYQYIFNTEFNISFHSPKSDRCDTCEEHKISVREKITLLPGKEVAYQNHILKKNAMREERARDKTGEIPVLCFDLENVVTCPRAEVSNFFYRQKLNLYNLTAHLSTTKKVYCALWTEALTGRAGNDIASAFIKILDRVFIDHPDMTELITWSDSCVPQNRNSMLSYAVMYFFTNHPTVQTITMKYSEPGHSCIQEVDNAHSAIEKAMRLAEFYSPLGFVRVLLKVNRRNSYVVLQMRKNDFKDFATCSKLFNYKLIPFTKVSALRFSQSLNTVEYKTSHADDFTHEVNIKIDDPAKRRRVSKGHQAIVPRLSVFTEPQIAKASSVVTIEKINSIKYMMRFMPLNDRQYYNALLDIETT